jgi:hypothetical protein
MRAGARDSYGGISVGLDGGTPIGSCAGAGPGPAGGISGGTLDGGTSGGVLGGDGAGDGLGGCGPGGCWLTASPRRFVGMKASLARLTAPRSELFRER